MPQSKLWLLTVQTQFRLRLTGAEADDFRAILNLPEDFHTPLDWWANLGEKGQIVATSVPPADAEEVLVGADLERYQAGMILSLRREKGNRIVLQLPKEAFRLGAVPDIGGYVAVCARPSGLEFWKADQWKEDAVKSAVVLSAHRARTG